MSTAIRPPERHGLVEIVSHVDHGRSQFLVQPLQLAPKLEPGGTVEGSRERFVEQEHLRLDGQRAGQGHALLLSTGEPFGIAVQ